MIGACMYVNRCRLTVIAEVLTSAGVVVTLTLATPNITCKTILYLCRAYTYWVRLSRQIRLTHVKATHTHSDVCLHDSVLMHMLVH